MNTFDFEDTRPYYNEEVPAAVKRISESAYFPEIAKYLFTKEECHSFAEEFKKIKTVDEFQSRVMSNAMKVVVKQTIKQLTYSGLDVLNNEKSNMFISNHRDIVLDSAILQMILLTNGLKTTEITFGSNLMSTQLVIDIGKINKMFKIVRGGTVRDIFTNSMKVSQYMRYAITQKNQSTWIAQRNGRTKDGHDETEVAVLKMFAMSSDAEFVSNLMELNITPIAISYEYEPCDFLKTRELYVSRRKNYTKEAGEDLISIISGIKQYKGNMSLAVCQPITEEELKKCNELAHNEKFKYLAQIIDQRIFSHYQLWKTNYIAHDLLYNSTTYSLYYLPEDKSKFQKYMSDGLEKIDGDRKELEAIFLEIYAAPVDNCYGKAIDSNTYLTIG